MDVERYAVVAGMPPGLYKKNVLKADFICD